MQKSTVVNSPRLLKLKRQRRWVLLKKVFLFLLTCSAIIVFLAYLFRASFLNINSVNIIGNKVTDTEYIRAIVEKNLTGNYLWFFPKTNILFYPKAAIKKELTDEFKRLKDITLSVTNGKILKISLAERTALYTWCGDNLLATDSNNQECYFLDQDGYIFDQAPYFSGEVYFKFYGSINKEVVLGTYFLADNFKPLVLFKETLETMKLKPVALVSLDNGEIKIFLAGKTTSTSGPEIIFKADSDFRAITENLQAALTTEPLLSKFKDKYSALKYIDLRFGNKVYYKFE